MPHQAESIRTQDQLHELNSALDSGTYITVRRMLHALPAADIAHLLESSPPPIRHVLWQLIDDEDEGEILQELSDELQSQFLRNMDAEEVAAATEGLEPDDVADILHQLPEKVLQEVLNSMDQQDRTRLEQMLIYPDDSAGGLMNTDTITVRARHTMDVVLRYLRRHSEIPEMTDSLIVVNRSDKFIGLLPLTTLLVSDPSATVREMMQTDMEAIPATMPDGEVANLFNRHDWVSAPVVDEAGKLLGRITIDDVVDVIREDADHSLMSMAGLDEDEDTFSPVFKTTPRRAVWLGINLVTAFIASSVINLFQGTIDKVVALAVLMPIVASMGGIAGTQTLTIMVRGMALGQIGHSNRRWLINREFLVGLLNGILWSLVVAVAATLWFDDPLIGLILAAAMVINLVTAALAGTIIPLSMKRFDIDPALAGSVVLTTVTDVVGFLAFLGLATVFYG
ncbi:MAG: magnesium transporter [Gammaproteobacteria bacterium]|nr:magnesium transporter [Gammaproteobacteria bacterium]